ncbi:MAG TPA: hypothetical protein VIH00_09305, partial [Candidatus Limnocylindrales bacterium]
DEEMRIGHSLRHRGEIGEIGEQQCELAPLAARGVPLAAKTESVIVAASALADQGKYDHALGLLRRIRTKDDVSGPEVIRVWYVTGDILARAGRTQDAAREFRKILRHDASAYDAAERVAQLS